MIFTAEIAEHAEFNIFFCELSVVCGELKEVGND
jgi:hypothetical protein